MGPIWGRQDPDGPHVGQNNRGLNQGALHLWSKFGYPSLNGWWVIAQTNLVTDGQTDGQTGAIPRGQNWPWVMKIQKDSKQIAMPCHCAHVYFNNNGCFSDLSSTVTCHLSSYWKHWANECINHHLYYLYSPLYITIWFYVQCKTWQCPWKKHILPAYTTLYTWMKLLLCW